MEAMSSLDVTKRHHSRSNNLENSFTKAIGSVIDKDGNQKWAVMLELVNNSHYRHGRRHDDSETVPRGFVVCSGPITPDKLDVANAMCVDWQVRHKKLNVAKDETLGMRQLLRKQNGVYFLLAWRNIMGGGIQPVISNFFKDQ